MFDTHVNLHGDAFAEDLNETLDRARAAGVKRFLAICDRFDNFPTVQAIADANPDIWCSAGVHPHHAKDFQNLTSDALAAAGAHPKTVAIGETGLDFHYNYSEKVDQIANLRKHIDAARTCDLPIILHCRDADELMGNILQEEAQKGAFGMLLHCYTGGIELAQKALELGAYFSVSGIISFKSANNVREVIGQLPPDRIILETDCPYLAPVPYRGRRNEPAYLEHVCAAYATLTEQDVGDVARMTTENALRLFSKAVS